MSFVRPPCRNTLTVADLFVSSSAIKEMMMTKLVRKIGNKPTLVAS